MHMYQLHVPWTLVVSVTCISYISRSFLPLLRRGLVVVSMVHGPWTMVHGVSWLMPLFPGCQWNRGIRADI